jgi:hypothetical protein
MVGGGTLNNDGVINNRASGYIAGDLWVTNTGIINNDGLLRIVGDTSGNNLSGGVIRNNAGAVFDYGTLSNSGMIANDGLFNDAGGSHLNNSASGPKQDWDRRRLRGTKGCTRDREIFPIGLR